ncbi:MAG: hypothetical protein HYS09_04995 [Chloroflexi bacterium]|nr:hypothetical protein [Chloroflexota bacterium]
MLRYVLRRVDQLESRVRSWARQIVGLLPQGLPLADQERDLLTLFLAQQRRLNLELDHRNGNGDGGLRHTLARVLTFLGNGHGPYNGDTDRLAHHLVACRLEDDIERAAATFCQDRNIPEVCDPVIDWRVSVRYMAQQLHRIACRINLKHDRRLTSPLRYELHVVARELSAEVIEKRDRLRPSFESVSAD